MLPHTATSSTTPTAMNPSSTSRSQKKIVWLFLNPMNPHAKIHEITLSGYEWLNLTMEGFITEKLALEMRRWFSFCPELRTSDLWIVSLLPLPHRCKLNSRPSAQRANVTANCLRMGCRRRQELRPQRNSNSPKKSR